jgi:hypothetical protein
MLKQIAKLGLLLMMRVSMSANAGLLGFGGNSWKEEVLLHDGQNCGHPPNIAGFFGSFQGFSSITRLKGIV